MMTRIAALLAPALFLFFTACSGSGDKKPPKTEKEMTAVDLQMLDNLHAHAQKAKQICSQDITPIAMEYVMQWQQTQQQVCLGAPIPGIGAGGGAVPTTGGVPAAQTPIPNGFGGAAPADLVVALPIPQCGSQPMPPPQPRQVSQECRDAVMNFVMTFNTIKLSNGTLYSSNAEAQQWFQSQFVDLINMVGGNVVAQAPGLPIDNPAFLGEMARMGVSLGQNLASQVPQLASLAGNAPALLASQLPPGVYQYMQQVGLK